MNRKLVEVGLSFTLLALGTVACDVVVKVTPTPGSGVSPSDALMCRTDMDCNPNIANPERFTRRCLNSNGTRNHFEFDGEGTCGTRP